MTYKEAINILSNKFELYPTSCFNGCDKCIDEARDMSIEALEKQIPKKPLLMICTIKDKYCLVCPNCVKAQISETQEKYCFNCGQAIDWSEWNGQKQ